MIHQYCVFKDSHGDFHVVYQIPGTASFQSVAVCVNQALAEELALNLSGHDISLVPQGEK